MPGETAELNQSIDAAAVNENSVRLTDPHGHVISGALSYDADEDIIRFEPARPLHNGVLYQWQLTGLGELPEHTVSFTTYHNLIQRRISQPDDILAYTQFHATDHLIVGNTSFDDPGPDGEFHTEDDVISRVTENLYQGVNRTHRIDYNQPGDDGVWMTDDDVVHRYFQFEYDENDRLFQTIFYSAPGDDGLWMTDDDVASSHFRTEYDDSGETVRRVTIADAGPDGVFFTDDDTPSRYTAHELDELGRTVRTNEFTGPGDDGVWFNEDDFVGAYDIWTYEGNGLLSVQELHGGNDDLLSRFVFHYDSNGNKTTQEIWDHGPDGEFDTADDFVASLDEYDTTE